MVELTAGEIPPELGIKKSAKIWWTLTDEAPALATHAFLPVVRRFLGPSGVSVETADISLAARILAAFPERLTPAQRRVDVLAKLGELTPLTTDSNARKSFLTEVEQLLQWAGDEVAVSGRAAVMNEEERVETHRAVHRFAPREP